ncbi:hypothetical protein QTG54_001414 [Skeletonema marinoi]|uniref:Uncharacterized protein n=1 Tax=Skeletonema marinoi TaxID=267567 RepID=A0AAD8YLR7_9STRA|nr:hypothetical protein QTG54_001414 [Skeletonema marinoi]
MFAWPIWLDDFHPTDKYNTYFRPTSGSRWYHTGNII